MFAHESGIIDIECCIPSELHVACINTPDVDRPFRTSRHLASTTAHRLDNLYPAPSPIPSKIQYLSTNPTFPALNSTFIHFCVRQSSTWEFLSVLEAKKINVIRRRRRWCYPLGPSIETLKTTALQTQARPPRSVYWYTVSHPRSTA